MSGSDGFNACARRSSFSPLSRSPIWHSIRPSFLCKIRLDGAVAAQLDRFLKLTDRFGQSCPAPGPAHPNASLVAVAGHEARGLLEIRGFDGFSEAPERLHVVGFYCECLSPGGNGVLGALPRSGDRLACCFLLAVGLVFAAVGWLKADDGDWRWP